MLLMLVKILRFESRIKFYGVVGIDNPTKIKGKDFLYI